jgi:signal transduction histidine kinase
MSGPAGDPADRVLVLAPAGRDAAVLCRLLAGGGVAAEACRPAGGLAARLDGGAGAVLVTAEALPTSAGRELGAWLAAQPPWSDLPVLLLDGGGPPAAAWALGRVTVLPRPARGLAVLTAVQAALRARRRQYEVRDLTAGLERRVAERTAELRAAQERAVRAERLAAVGQMAAGLAHESRNALQRGHACLTMLELRLKDRPEELDLVRRAQAAQDDLHRLYEDVRAYAAPIRLDRAPCDLAEVWRQAWDDLAWRAGWERAELHEESGGLDLRVAADAGRLKQVFRNLFENAMATGAHPLRVEVRCGAAAAGGRPAARVAVRDNGPGLPREAFDKLFEPFFTTKTHGTGLGLPICRRILEEHGGTLEAAEPGGPGAEFVLILPRSAE